jgi:hypothetical protein
LVLATSWPWLQTNTVQLIGWAKPGTSIKRGGLGVSVKCPKSSLPPLFQAGYVM